MTDKDVTILPESLEEWSRTVMDPATKPTLGLEANLTDADIEKMIAAGGSKLFPVFAPGPERQRQDAGESRASILVSRPVLTVAEIYQDEVFGEPLTIACVVNLRARALVAEAKVEALEARMAAMESQVGKS